MTQEHDSSQQADDLSWVGREAAGGMLLASYEGHGLAIWPGQSVAEVAAVSQVIQETPELEERPIDRFLANAMARRVLLRLASLRDAKT